MNLRGYQRNIFLYSDPVFRRYTMHKRSLKCVMKCDVLQSSVNTCVQSGRHRNRERLLPSTNYTEVPHSVLLPMVNSRGQFLDISLVVC